MKRSQRQKELIQGLEATAAEEVFQDITQVAEVIGIEKAEELAISLVHMSQQIKQNTPRSAILPGKSTLQGGIAGFNREEILAALKEVKIDEDE